MDMKEIKLSSETIFEGRVVKLERDKVLCPNGKESFREVVRHNGGAAILCVTPDNKIMLIKQFRYPYDEVMYEIPAGKLEENEDPKMAAIREFEEETGAKAEDLEFLNIIYPTCGYSSEKIYLYLAKDFVQTETKLDEDEVIEVEYIAIEKVFEMIDKQIIRDSKIICALMSYMIKYGNISVK